METDRLIVLLTHCDKNHLVNHRMYKSIYESISIWNLPI